MSLPAFGKQSLGNHSQNSIENWGIASPYGLATPPKTGGAMTLGICDLLKFARRSRQLINV
jgi:hypothetical protein